MKAILKLYTPTTQLKHSITPYLNIMPLVVPGINSNDGGSVSDSWISKLMGKKLADRTDETSFAKKDLPENHRVVGEGEMTTMDHNPDRYSTSILPILD